MAELLDEFETQVMRKFPHHRFTIQRQKEMDGQFSRNRGPGVVQSDIDFMMDGTIPPPDGRSIQSDHWVPMSWTGFIQVVSWLSSAAWMSRSSDLAVGTAVTVEPADGCVPDSIIPASGSYWAEVVELPSQASAMEPEMRIYGVRRYGASEDDPLLRIERRFLRHRSLHTKAFVHVSNDKQHDSHAAQMFLEKMFAWIEEHYVTTGEEKFFAWHFHSDNAPSHFKSRMTMYYLTTLPSRLASWARASGQAIRVGAVRSFSVYWEFGAPGHGKGVWDGIGAWMKRTVRQDIVDHRPPSLPTIKTTSGSILTPEQVYEHLKASFDTEKYVEDHKHRTINQACLHLKPSNRRPPSPTIAC